MPGVTGGQITRLQGIVASGPISTATGTLTIGGVATGSAWELIVVKAGTSDGGLTLTGISGGGLTWTSQVNVAGVAGSSSQARIWTAWAPPGSSFNVVITATNGTGTRYCFGVAERWQGATLAPTPATGQVSGSATPSGTITTVGTNSVVTWFDADWNVTTAAATYLSGANSTSTVQTGPGASWYVAWQRVASPGTVTFGMSAPTGQKATIAALELISLPATRRNQNANPALATSSAGWSSQVSEGRAGTVGRVPVTGMDRPWAYQYAQVTSGRGSISSPAVPAVAGDQWSATVQWRPTCSTTIVYVSLYWYDAAGNFVGIGVTTSTKWPTPNVARRTLLAGVAPAGTASAIVKVQVNDAGGGIGTVQVTALRMENAADPGLSFADGGSPNWAWDGAAGASTSAGIGSTVTLGIAVETMVAPDVGVGWSYDLDVAYELEEAVDYSAIDRQVEVEEALAVTPVGEWVLDVAVETETVPAVTVEWSYDLAVATEAETLPMLYYDTVLPVAEEFEFVDRVALPRRTYIPGTARIKGMRVMAQQIMGGKWLDWELDVADLSLTRTLSGPQQITGNLRPALPRVAELALVPWNTWIHCEDDDGLIRGSAILATPFGIAEDQRAVECTGVAAVPASVPFDGSFSSYSADPLDVIRMLWAHVQSYPLGNLGVVLSQNTSKVRIGGYEFDTSTTTGPRVDDGTGGDEGDPYEINWWDHRLCGEEIDNLVGNVPLDYLEGEAWNANRSGITHRIDLGWPRAGAKRTDLRFAQGENVIGAVPVNEIDESYITDVVVTGVGEGISMIVGRASRQTGQVRRVAMINEPTVKNPDRAKAIAEAELRRRTNPRGVDTLLVDAYHQNAPYGSYGPGDDILVQVDVDWVGTIIQWHRVMELTYTPDESAVSIKLKPSDSFRYGSDA